MRVKAGERILLAIQWISVASFTDEESSGISTNSSVNQNMARLDRKQVGVDVWVAYRIVTQDVYVVFCVNRKLWILRMLASCSYKHTSEQVFEMVALAQSG